MAQRNTSDVWTGPSVKEMVAAHTLGKEIRDRHNDPCPVFDDPSILKLRRFVNDPSQSRQLLQEYDMLDDEGDEPGAGAKRKGSLVGYIIAAHGTEKPVLADVEIKELKEWFHNGGGRTDTELEALNA